MSTPFMRVYCCFFLHDPSLFIPFLSSPQQPLITVIVLSAKATVITAVIPHQKRLSVTVETSISQIASGTRVLEISAQRDFFLFKMTLQ